MPLGVTAPMCLKFVVVFFWMFLARLGVQRVFRDAHFLQSLQSNDPCYFKIILALSPTFGGSLFQKRRVSTFR